MLCRQEITAETTALAEPSAHNFANSSEPSSHPKTHPSVFCRRCQRLPYSQLLDEIIHSTCNGHSMHIPKCFICGSRSVHKSMGGGYDIGRNSGYSNNENVWNIGSVDRSSAFNLASSHLRPQLLLVTARCRGTFHGGLLCSRRMGQIVYIYRCEAII